MNNLNSILIEGTVKETPELSYTPAGTAECRFLVMSNRLVKIPDGGLAKETIEMPIYTQARLAEVCAEYVREGRIVRVVGRLAMGTRKVENESQELLISAEHVEFKQTKEAMEKERAEAAIR